MSPQKRALQAIKGGASMGTVNARTLAALIRKKHLTPEGVVTKRGEALLSGRLGGAIGLRSDLLFGKRRLSPAHKKAPKKRRATKAQERAHLGEQAKHWKKGERMTAQALARILGPTGKAHAVKVSKASGDHIGPHDVAGFAHAGWGVSSASSAPSKTGTGLAGHLATDWTFQNPGEPLGPRGAARAVVIVGTVTASVVDALRASGWDVSAAPKRQREAIKNPGPNKDASKVYKALVSAAKRNQALNLEDLSDKLKLTVARVAEAIKALLAAGLAHVAGRDLFGQAYAAGAPPQAGLSSNPSPGERKHGPHASAQERKAAAEAVKAARKWYGNEELVTAPKKLKAWKPPTSAVELGNVVAIEYESDKFDGTPRVYRHDAESLKKLYASPDGGTFIVSPGFRITKRGIEG